MADDNGIEGGAFQIARKIFESDLWANRPSTWKVIWFYIIGNVAYSSNEKFERGEGFFNFTKELPLIGNDVTEDMVKKFCAYARRNQMLSTERSTRGVRIKVLNYNTYQTIGNYVRTTLSTSRARAEHEPSTTIVKKEKKEKKEKNTPLTPQGGADETFESFWSVYPRKVNKVQARRAWERLKPNIETQCQILIGLEKQKQTEGWKKEKGKFVPHPTTFLNGRRWEDEVIVETTKSTKYAHLVPPPPPEAIDHKKKNQ